MTDEWRHRLNAYFDGELSSSEQEGLKRQIADDSESQAYLACLETTRQALAVSHSEMSGAVPDWKSVKARRNAIKKKARSRRTLRAALTTAAVIALGVSFWLPFRQAGVPSSAEVTTPQSLVNAVEIVETDLENATPVVYLDEPSGWTVVWVMENGVAGEI